MEKSKINLKCFMFGHKLNENMDGGYDVCDRCGMHEFYDGADNQKSHWYKTLPHYKWVLRYTLYSRPRKWILNRIYNKCICGKYNRILWFKMPPHKDNGCLPF